MPIALGWLALSSTVSGRAGEIPVARSAPPSLGPAPPVAVMPDGVAASAGSGRSTACGRDRESRCGQSDGVEDVDDVGLGFVVCALALTLVLARLSVRADATVFRANLALQRVIAQASHLFITADPAETRSAVMQALAVIGDGLGLDRAALVTAERDGIHLWSREGARIPDRWVEDLRGGLPASPGQQEDVGLVEATCRGHAAGSVEGPCRAWVRLRSEADVVGLLSLEWDSEAPTWLQSSTDLLLVVGDAFGAALRRERTWRERLDVEMALRHAQRLEAIGIFTTGVAHNFNNVLNVMLGHAEIASGALPPATAAADHLTAVMQAGARARDVVSQILDFGRRGQVPHHPCRAETVVIETLNGLRHTLPPRVDLRYSPPACAAWIEAEPGQLQQLVMNLVRNAIQASESGDTIRVALDVVELSEPRALSNATLRPGRYLRVDVVDEGCGMDQITRQQIFEPFFTTRATGTGLGLATAFEFVRERRGGFDVESAEGEGTTFRVWLPTALDAVASSDALGSLTVMLVGCDRSTILRDEERLADLALEAVGYVDPAGALAALRADRLRFDIAVVDSDLGSMTGLAFARRASLLSGLPVIVSLAGDEKIDCAACRGAGVVDIVRRPWNLEDLADTLARHVAPRAPSK